jgi:metal-responsive CopG/Arc/MetJ family transcriptional regulator
MSSDETQFTVRMPEEMVEDLEEFTAMYGDISRNAGIKICISEHLAREDIREM